MSVTTLSQKSTVGSYIHNAGDSSETVDIFADGSGVELVTLNGNLNSASHGSLSVRTGTLKYSQGVFDQCVEGDNATILDGLDSFSFTGDKTSDCTISFWIKPSHSAGSDWETAIDYANNLWGEMYAGVSKNNNGQLFLGVMPGDNSFYSLEVSGTEFVHCVLEHDFTHQAIRIYINGQQKHEITGVTVRSDNYDETNERLSVCGSFCCDYNYFSVALIDQVRFINRALNPDGSDVGKLYSERLTAKNTFNQLSLVGEYVSPFDQESSVEGNNLTALVQKQTTHQLSDAAIQQKSTIHQTNIELLAQSSDFVKYPHYIFAQSSRVEPFHPYVSLVHTANIGEGSAIRHSEFESDIKTIAGGENYDYLGSLKFSPVAPFSGGLRLSGGDTVLIDPLQHSNTYVNGIFFLWSFWIHVSDDELLNLPDGKKQIAQFEIEDLGAKTDFIHVYFDATTITIESKNGSWQSPVIDFVETVQNIQVYVFDSYLSVYVSGNLAFECEFVCKNHASDAKICYGAYTDDPISTTATYSRFLDDSILDQVRFINGEISLKKVYEVHNEHLVTVPFTQNSGIHESTINVMKQKSVIGNLHTAPFEQKSWFMQGQAGIFEQCSKVGYFSKFSTFKQVETVHKDVEVVIIKRTNA